MLDRESTFAQPEIVELLKTKFIPVAIDQAYQRRQKDTEGEFYRKIASQSPRNNFQSTTQGFYVADASGKLYLYNNNRDPEKVLRLIRKSLQDFAPQKLVSVDPIKEITKDQRYNVSVPDGGLAIRVHGKVLGGYEPTTDKWRAIFQSAVSRDNLWISRSEHQSLVNGKIAASLIHRIARYHLVDSTRGEPPMWRENEIREIELTLRDGKISGHVHLETDSKDRGYQAKLKGELEVKDGNVTKFDIVCLGEFWGEGRYTRNAPKGKFPFAVTFSIADGSDIADGVPPQGSRGWVQGYCAECVQR